MTIMQAWRSVRQDPAWKKKAGLAALVNLIPYLGAYLVMGYAANYARAVTQRVDGGRLPDWNALGDHGRMALHVFVVSFVYAIPLMLLVLPLSLLAGLGTAFSAEAEFGGPLLVVFILSIAFTIALSFAYVPVTYAGLAAVIATGSSEAAFKVRDVWERACRHAGLLLATSARMIGIGLLVLVVPLGIGIPAFVAAIVSTESGGAGAVMALGIGAYLISLLVVMALSGLVQLVAYRLVAEYAVVAYEVVPPAPVSAATA